MWIYDQASGKLTRDGLAVAAGYSGGGAGKNNPAMQGVRDVGPIPQGRYRIGAPADTATHGPVVMRLTPCAGTDECGRGGFLIHGDSIAAPGTASHGCIILARPVRQAIAESGDGELEVV